MNVTERFLKYVSFDTQSDENSDTVPTSAKQKVLGQALAEELVELALAQHRIYPLTYTNYVMVAQKYVTGLDKCPIVPEFADWLAISVNG